MAHNSSELFRASGEPASQTSEAGYPLDPVVFHDAKRLDAHLRKVQSRGAKHQRIEAEKRNKISGCWSVV
jgi:hypothetical protein